MTQGDVTVSDQKRAVVSEQPVIEHILVTAGATTARDQYSSLKLPVLTPDLAQKVIELAVQNAQQRQLDEIIDEQSRERTAGIKRVQADMQQAPVDLNVALANLKDRFGVTEDDMCRAIQTATNPERLLAKVRAEHEAEALGLGLPANASRERMMVEHALSLLARQAAAENLESGISHALKFGSRKLDGLLVLAGFDFDIGKEISAWESFLSIFRGHPLDSRQLQSLDSPAIKKMQELCTTWGLKGALRVWGRWLTLNLSLDPQRYPPK